MQHFLTILTTSLLAFTGVLMVFIILLQRGRGGGLAGAFGAMGGQSAFGTKAGDVFTRITIGIALVWVVLAAASGYAMRAETKGRFKGAPEEVAVEKKDGAAGAVGNKVAAENKPNDGGNADDSAKTKPAQEGKPVTTPAPKTSIPAPAKPASPPAPSK
jgi:preprotein translocase subunit SecG